MTNEKNSKKKKSVSYLWSVCFVVCEMTDPDERSVGYSACRFIRLSEEENVSKKLAEGCQVSCVIRFQSCLVAVTRARCYPGQCSSGCCMAEKVARKVVCGLRGPVESCISLAGVGQVVAQALDLADDRVGISVLVLIAVDSFSSEQLPWAFSASGRGSFAFFRCDPMRHTHFEVACSHLERSSSSSSPLSTSPVSPVVSATNSSSSSPRWNFSYNFVNKYDASAGLCAVGQWFLIVVDTDLQRRPDSLSKLAAASIWKRSAPTGSAESIGAATKVIFFLFFFCFVIFVFACREFCKIGQTGRRQQNRSKRVCMLHCVRSDWMFLFQWQPPLQVSLHVCCAVL
jgi:hypothetical protein